MSDRPDPASNDGRLLLEELSDRAMPGADRRHLGNWVLRASHGATSRANTVWPSGDPGRPLTSACDVVEQWYRDRGLVAGFQVWVGADPTLAAELDRRGYRRAEGALVLTRGVSDWASSTDATKTDRAPSVTEFLTPLVERLFTEPDRLAELLDSELRKCFVTVSDGAGRLLGGGIGVLDGHELGVFAMKTLPVARRQGTARRVLDELVSSFIYRSGRLPDNQISGIVSPHAGYVYSGAVAGAAFASSPDDIKNVIVIAPPHSYPVKGASVYDGEGYETPLGTAPVQKEITSRLLTAGLSFQPGGGCRFCGRDHRH